MASRIEGPSKGECESAALEGQHRRQLPARILRRVLIVRMAEGSESIAFPRGYLGGELLVARLPFFAGLRSRAFSRAVLGPLLFSVGLPFFCGVLYAALFYVRTRAGTLAGSLTPA